MSGDLPLVRTTDISSGVIDWQSVPYCDVAPSDVEKYILDDGDILISRAGSVGKSFLIRKPRRSVFASYLIKFRPLIDERYINFFLQTQMYWNQISESTSGIAIPNVNANKLRRVKLPVAPITEQARIADKIDELFSELDAGVASLKRTMALLQKYRQAVLKAAVTGELTRDWRERHPENSGADTLAEIWDWRRKAAKSVGMQLPKPRSLNPMDLWNTPESWAWCAMDEAGDVQLGQQRAPQHHHGQHMRPYLRVANVLEDELDLRDIKSMNFVPKELSKFELVPGDILLNEGQSPDLLGRSAIYNGEIEGCCMQKTLLRFRSFPNVVSRFAQIVFRSYMHSGRFRKISRITTNIGHLTRIRFVTMEFPVPSIQEQEEIANRFEAIDTNIKYLERLLMDVGDGALRQSILKAAFAGRLVPQDPSDEPASVLLERIHAERAAKPRPTRGLRTGGRSKFREGQLDLALDRGDTA